MVTPHTRVLILGSLPGEASLAAGRYYAHPQNQFWRLTGTAIGREDLAALDYADRLKLLLAAGVGLWDTVASARRAGSLDGAIREVEAAPLAELVATLPQLCAVAFNGAKAAALGCKAIRETRLALIDLPSSSPAHAAMSFADKAARWRRIGDFLSIPPLPSPPPPGMDAG